MITASETSDSIENNVVPDNKNHIQNDPVYYDRLSMYGLDENRTFINSDGSIDYYGGVDLSNMKLTEIPFNFRHVSGYFDCSDNNLTSLKGAPRKVDEGFYCHLNKLTSLEGSPQKVGGDFYCENNNLSSLSGISKVIKGRVISEYGNNIPKEELIEFFNTHRMSKTILGKVRRFVDVVKNIFFKVYSTKI